MSHNPTNDLVKLAAGCLIGGVVIAFKALRSLKRTRAVENLPTAKIASAPSGECEFQGVAWPTADGLNTSPIGTSALYYAFELEELVRQGKKKVWKTVFWSKGETPFIVADSSGFVFLDPKGAEVETSCSVTSWRDLGEKRQASLIKYLESKNIDGFPPRGGFLGWLFPRVFRVCEKSLCPGSPVFMHGTFHPQAEGNFVVPYAGFSEFYEEAAKLLSAPEAALLSRFDFDRNGRVEAVELKAGFFDMAKAAAQSARQSASSVIAPGAIRCAGTVKAGPGQPLYLADCHEGEVLKRIGSHALPRLACAILLIAAGAFLLATALL